MPDLPMIYSLRQNRLNINSIQILPVLVWSTIWEGCAPLSGPHSWDLGYRIMLHLYCRNRISIYSCQAKFVFWSSLQNFYSVMFYQTLCKVSIHRFYQSLHKLLIMLYPLWLIHCHLEFFYSRMGRFTPEGRPRDIPGHSVPMAALGNLVFNSIYNLRRVKKRAESSLRHK